MDRYTIQGIAGIAEDTISGAAELAEKSAAVLANLVGQQAHSNPDQLRAEILEAGLALIRAHPTMAPLVNLVNQVLEQIDGSTIPLPNAVLAATGEFTRRLRTHESAIAEATCV